jgi:hypothetical protein
LRVEILRQEGSAGVKYEVFQRLNTGGTKLSEQEVRNCTAIMIDRSSLVFVRFIRDVAALTRLGFEDYDTNEIRSETG